MKFFNAPGSDETEEEDDPKRLRVQFKKKKGDLADWYDLLKQMKEAHLTSVFCQTKNQEVLEEGDGEDL